MVCFNMLFRPHDSGIMRNGLIWVNFAHFLSHFLIKFFLYKFHRLTLSLYEWFKIELYNLFWLSFIGLSQSHDQSRRFCRLTQVKSSHFLIFFLWDYLSLMTWLIDLADWTESFFMFFLFISFLISCFNIGLIRNQNS